jgi:hypothetical protein
LINYKSIAMKRLYFKCSILLFLLFFLYQSSVFSQSKSGVKEKNIQYKGKPFFPIGFYYYPDNMTDTDNTELDLLVKSGFNTIHIDIKDSSNAMPFLDQCQAKGLKVIAQFGHDFGKYSMGDVGFLEMYKNHPALLGWSIADDANNGKYVLDTIINRQKIVKASKPNLPTFLSVYKNHEKGISKKAEELLPTGDVLSYEIYTIDNWGQAMGAFTKNEELLQVDRELSIFQKANLGHFNKILVAIPQTFSWGFYSTNKEAKLPTPAELRSITYTGILNGAKGVLNYTFGQKAIPEKNIPNFKLPMADDLWQESISIAKELNKLKSVYLYGKRKKIDLPVNPWLRMTQWKYKGKIYLIISNLHKTEAQEIYFGMRLEGPLKNVFKTRNASLKYRLGKIKGSVPAAEVQIYEVRNTNQNY